MNYNGIVLPQQQAYGFPAGTTDPFTYVPRVIGIIWIILGIIASAVLLSILFKNRNWKEFVVTTLTSMGVSIICIFSLLFLNSIFSYIRSSLIDTQSSYNKAYSTNFSEVVLSISFVIIAIGIPYGITYLLQNIIFKKKRSWQSIFADAYIGFFMFLVIILILRWYLYV